MAFSRKEFDDISFKIKDVMSVYNKTVSDRAMSVWIEALLNFKVDEIIKAFNDHVRGESVGRQDNHSNFAPRPSHIIELIKRHRAHQKSYVKTKEFEDTSSPKIAKAWFICMDIFHGFAFIDRNPDIKMSRGEAIDIANREAAKMRIKKDYNEKEIYVNGKPVMYNTPNSIPDKYKIKKYWDDEELEFI